MTLLFLILLLFQTPTTHGVVAGQVMGLDGAPAANLRVSVMEAGEPGQDAEPVARALVAFAQTDASGRYRIENIPPGRYYVLAGQLENPTFYPGAAELEKATVVSLTASASVSTLNFALSPDTQSGLIQVVVRRSDTGAPIAGAQVLVRRPTDLTFGAAATPVTTDGGGQVLIGQLPTGRYSINVQSEGYVGPAVGQRAFSPTISGQVSIAGDQKEARIVFSMNPATTIEGRILAPDGRPLSNAAVSALQMGYQEGRRGLLASGANNVPTDAQGRYRLSVGAAGEYYIRIETPPAAPRGTTNTVRVVYFPGVADTLKARPVVAKDTGVTTVPDLTMPSGVAVSGTVTNPFPGGRGSPNGTVNRSISSFFVVARGESLELNPPSFQNAVPGSLGASSGPTAFELRGVPPGNYDLFPMFADNLGGSNTYYTARTPISVRESSIADVRITLRDNPELKGRFVLEGNVPPIAWDSVRIQLGAKEIIPSPIRTRTNLGPAGAPRPDPSTHQFTLPAAEGRFSLVINGLPDTVYVADLRQGGKSLYRDGAVTVGTGAQEDIEVVLKPGTATVLGTVKGATDQSVVLLRPEWSGNLQLYKARRVGPPSGQFVLSGVAPGNYGLYVMVTTPQGGAVQNDEFMAKYEGRKITVKESETLVVNDLVMIDDRTAAPPAPPQTAPEISNRVIRSADTPVVTLGATPAAGARGAGGFGGGARGARGTNIAATANPARGGRGAAVDPAEVERNLARIPATPEERAQILAFLMLNGSNLIVSDKALAERMFRRGQDLEPANSRWLSQLGLLYGLAASTPTTSNLPLTPAEINAKALAAFEGALALGGSDFLAVTADAARRAKALDKAVDYGNRGLASGNADVIHNSNTTLGMIALDKDDIDAAKKYLLDSGKIPTTPVLGSFGPDMTLARELLARGARDTVLAYLEECLVFWTSGQTELQGWIADLKGGRTPVIRSTTGR